MRAPIRDPEMADFLTRVDEIEALAESSPGFIWRLTAPGSSLPELQGYGDTFLFTLTVWESVEALRSFTYRGAHVELLRERRRWFRPMTEACYALWWIRRGTQPGVTEALERLEHLRHLGPTPEAFSFAQPYPPPTPDLHPRILG
jgi:hypothetical protein